MLDAALVAAAQAVEHYEMCRYGTLIAWAEELGHNEIVRFLTTNLNEVAEVKLAEWTSKGELRQPVYLGLRSDKRATDVVRERELPRE